MRVLPTAVASSHDDEARITRPLNRFYAPKDLVRVVESAVADGGGVVHQQLLDLSAVGNFGQAQRASSLNTATDPRLGSVATRAASTLPKDRQPRRSHHEP